MIAAVLFMLLQGCSTGGKNESSNRDTDTSGTHVQASETKEGASDSTASEKPAFEPGNILNGGIAAGSGDWVFYTDSAKNDAIFKMKADGSEKAQLVSDSAQYINAVEDKLYYVNKSDHERIYSIKFDGTDKIKVSDDSSEIMYVLGNSIYYVNKSDCENIYKMDTSGENKTLLVDFEYEPEADVCMTIDNGWIYYGDKPDGALHKIKMDGTGKYDFKNGEGWNLNVVNGSMYHTGLIPNESADFAIYRKDGDDGSDTMLDSGSFSYNPYNIIVRGEWIYIIDQWGPEDTLEDDYSLCRVNTDGSNGQRLTKRGALNFSIAGDWIYFSGYEDDKSYRVKIDGTGEELLSDG